MIRLHYNSVTRVLWVRLMPEEIHACHQLWVRNENYNWMVSGQLTLEELKKLRTKVGMRKSVAELASTKGPPLLTQALTKPFGRSNPPTTNRARSRIFSSPPEPSDCPPS